MKKSLIITEWAPPLNEGSPIMMKNLLQYFPEGSYCILMDTLKEDFRRVDMSFFLNCPYYFFNLPLYRGENSTILKFFTLLELILIPFLVIKGIKIVKKEKIDNILAPTNNRSFFLSAYFVHLITKKNLFLFMFDLFEEVQLSRIKKQFCKYMEKKMFKSAFKIFVTTENMKKYYLGKYGVNTELIPHSTDLPSDSTTLHKRFELRKNIYTIVYTGSIYSAQYDSVVRLINVVNKLPNINLFLYTTHRQGELLKGSVKLTQRIIISYAERNDVFRIQRDADILFLPYTFSNDYFQKRIVENQAPVKMVEYFISGTPILLHAPPYSFLCQYNAENKFALAVHVPSEKVLKDGILRLLEDGELRRKCVENAFITAKKHDAKVISARLQNYLLN